MSQNPYSVEEKGRARIFRKKESTPLISNTSIKRRITTFCATQKLNLKPSTPKSVDDSESMFSNRSKLIRNNPGAAPVTPHTQPRMRPIPCHSTTTLDSRYASAGPSSHLHKPGFIPSYLRNKTATKNLVAAQILSNKKQFFIIKKELSELQNKAVEYYKRYRESLVNFNKLNGKNCPPAIDELQIIEFKARSGKTKPPITRGKLISSISFSQLKHINDEKILSNISQQVHDIQLHSFKLLQDFSDRLSLINEQMKAASNSAGDNYALPENIQKLFEEVEVKILGEEEQQNTRVINFITSLKQIMFNQEGEPCNTNGSLIDEYDNYRKINERRNNELEMKIKDLELQKIQEEYKNAELTKTIINENFSVNKLNAALTESKAKRDDRDQELEKVNLKVKQLDLFSKRLKQQLDDKMIEVIAKDKTILELKNSIKMMQEKMVKYSIQVQKLGRKVARADDDNRNHIEQLKTNYDEEVKTCNGLRLQINELNLGMADDSRALRDENLTLKNGKKVLMDEIDSLKLSLNELLQTKTNSERSKAEDSVFRREMKRQHEEVHLLKTIIMEMKEEMHKREVLVAQKTHEINDLKNRAKQVDKFQSQEELIKLQESNNQKTNEIERLQNDLNKADHALRMIRIRTELMQSLHEKEGREGPNKIQISGLNSEIERKTFLVNQLNQEVCSKTEELENLFSTLGAKNLEVQRQNNIIKILEEKHERNQKVRAKLKGKIEHLETQNAELKHFIFQLQVTKNSNSNNSSDDS